MDKYKLLNLLLNQDKSLPYQSNLDVPQSFEFANWASQNNVPVNLSKHSDYDMPGFFKQLNNGRQPVMSNLDDRLHFSDEFKTPQHKTFSNESIYADQSAPHWEGNALRDSEGNLKAVELPNDNILTTKLQKWIRK